MPDATCSVEGCDHRGPYVRHLCNMHYWRWRKGLDVTHEARRPIAERLAERLVRTESGCLEWTGTIGSHGYGKIGEGGRGGRILETHRVAWMLAHPNEPLPKIVRHSCDNRPCCEPTHLLAGTQKDNMQDAVKRGRVPRGEGHYNVKLTDAEVMEIRAYPRPRISDAALAARYKVSPSCITGIRTGKTRV